MIPHLASFVFLNIAGNITDRLIRGGMDVGKVRKLMQSIGFGGLGTALFFVGEVESAWTAIAIMSVGSALGAFVTGGFVVNPHGYRTTTCGNSDGDHQHRGHNSGHYRGVRQRTLFWMLPVPGPWFFR